MGITRQAVAGTVLGALALLAACVGLAMAGDEPVSVSSDPAQTSDAAVQQQSAEPEPTSAAVPAGLPRFADWRDFAEPGDRWLHWMLDKPTPELSFTGETPLSEILAELSDHYTDTWGQVGESDIRNDHLAGRRDT